MVRALLFAAAVTAFVPAPAPGPKGLEKVPVPLVAPLAAPRALKLGQTIDRVKCEVTEKLAFHIHAHLAIFVNGKQRQVPYGIGIGPPLHGVPSPISPFVTSGTCIAWMHTHTADGIIHMEAPKLMSFALGQFFEL